MADISEMTMVLPFAAGMSVGTLPYYPWSPAEIEEMAEEERVLYRDRLRETRQAVTKK